MEICVHMRFKKETKTKTKQNTQTSFNSVKQPIYWDISVNALCWFVCSMLTPTYEENVDVQKTVNHRLPSLQTPVKLTKYFWSREEVMDTVCAVQVVRRDKAVKVFYIGNQEKSENKVSFHVQ